MTLGQIKGRWRHCHKAKQLEILAVLHPGNKAGQRFWDDAIFHAFIHKIDLYISFKGGATDGACIV